MTLDTYRSSSGMAGKTGKTSQKKNAKARWMWLEQVFHQIDELRARQVKLDKEIKNIKDTIDYLSKDFDARLKEIEDFLGGQESIREVNKNRKVYKEDSLTS